MRTLMLNIATNKYTQFVDDFYKSCEEFFLPDGEVHHLLFTDNMEFETSVNVPFKKSYIEHKPFPEPTLKRFHYFLQEREYIETFDYVFYCDVDMAFVKPVLKDEIASDLTLTLHPLIRKKDAFTYESRVESTAYIDKNIEGDQYFCGGFNGGSSKKFMELSEHIANNIDIDERNDIIAVWHDESHINRYAIDNPPQKIIDWCVTDWFYEHTQAGKLICISKDHAEVRS
jgi:histo-blood group ABO system transferase